MDRFIRLASKTLTMLRTALALTCLSLLLTDLAQSADGPAEEGFVSLWDGESFDGWKASEHKDAWSIEDGAIVANGERSHLFYVGDRQPFKNFILKVDCMTEPGSNGGIYFHTEYQDEGWPAKGFEAQVNNSQSDPKRTGSLYAITNVLQQHIPDNQWWTQTIKVEGRHIQILLDDEVVIDYMEPNGVQPTDGFDRRIDEGTFALQAHDPGSKVYFKNIRVKRLAD